MRDKMIEHSAIRNPQSAMDCSALRNPHSAIGTLTVLNTIATAVSQLLSLDEIVSAALDATLEATGFEVGGIALWDEEKQQLQPMAIRGVEPQLLDAFLGPPRAGGNRERVLRTGQPVFHDDTAHDPTVNPEIARLGFTISGMVPLLHKGKVLGILAVATRAPRQWAEEDKTLLTAVGQQIAIAVANARLYEELRQSEEKYRSLVNSTNDLIFTVDLEGNILFANPAAKAFTGYEPEETIGHNFAEYVHPDDVPDLLAGIQQVLSGEPLESIKGIGRDAEYRLVRRDGQIIWVATRAWPVRDARGKIIGFSGITRDITERRRAEDALRRSEKRYRYFVEQTAEGFYCIESERPISIDAPEDEQIRLMYQYMYVAECNDIFAQMYGYPNAEALVGIRFIELHGSPDVPENIEALRAFIRNDYKIIDAETLEVDKDGNNVYFLNNAVGIVEDGHLVAVWGTQRDITERKRAEEALRDAEAKYRTLVEQLPAIIYIVEFGEVTRTIYISPQVESLLGFSQAEWLADPELWIKQIHPDDRERVVAEVRGKDAEGKPLDLEYRVMTRDGRVLWFRNRTALVRDETGRVRYSQGVMFDITERKRAEEALRRRLDELTVLQAIATAGTEATSEDELIERATQIIGETLHLDSFGVILLDEGSGLLRPHPSHRLRAGGEALTLRLGEGIVGQVALSGQPRRVPDVRLDPDYVAGDPQTRSELCVPLKVGGRVIGVINTESTELDAYSEADERLLTTVAGQLATAIEKVRLFEQMEQRALEMTSLYTTSLRLGTAEELNEVLEIVVSQAVTLLQAQGGGLYLYDQTADELELAVVHGIVLEEDLGIRLKPGEGLSGKVMQKRQPMVVDDYRTWEGRSSKFEGRPYTAVAAAPLLWRDELIGVLDVTDDKELRTFDENDMRLLTLLAQQAAAAIANARLFEETRRLQEFSQSIVQSMSEGIAIQDREGIFTFVNPAAAEMLGYTSEELVGQHWTIVVPPDQQPIIEAADERRKRGEADRYEVELVRKDGERLSVLISGIPRFEDGRFVGTLAVFTDITERKRAEEELRRSYAQLRRTLERTIQVVISTIEMRDPYTAGHQRRVTQLACAIARELGLPEEEIEGLRMAGLVHDLGKISIPAEILSKPGKLGPIEWTMIKAHPQIGYDVLKAVEFPWAVAETVLQHHERIDGSGYPLGLSGEKILMKARILAVADVVEAMSSHRPYRPALGIDEALEEIERNKGILYDPEVVDACVNLFTKKGFKWE